MLKIPVVLLFQLFKKQADIIGAFQLALFMLGIFAN